ncbi:5-formyltetrahydrofolate cyclo-ligase [Roseburia hominis]
METKKQIRAAVLQRRTELPVFDVEEKSRKIICMIKEHSWFREAEQVLVYIDFRKEVVTRELIESCWRQKKSVYVPKVKVHLGMHGNRDERPLDVHLSMHGNKKAMQFYRIMSWEDVRPGAWGILEPIEGLAAFSGPQGASCSDTLMIMPGVAFDENRNRIGYGGGYYDRYLEQYPSIHKIAAAFECQIVKKVPAEETDLRPDYIITEERVITPDK